jgi:hypothetical protein
MVREVGRKLLKWIRLHDKKLVFLGRVIFLYRFKIIVGKREEIVLWEGGHLGEYPFF